MRIEIRGATGWENAGDFSPSFGVRQKTKPIARWRNAQTPTIQHSNATSHHTHESFI
jgi:hypothetical protein